MDTKQSKLEQYFESLLFNMRFITIVAVIGSLLSSLIIFLDGSLSAVKACVVFVRGLGHFQVEAHEVDVIVPLVISAVDKYLFATVLLIFGMGLYELFISRIDPASRREDTRPYWLKIASIDDLKGSLGKVILMILIVTFFKESLRIEYKNATDLVLLGAGILLIAGSLYVQHVKSKEH